MKTRNNVIVLAGIVLTLSLVTACTALAQPAPIPTRTPQVQPATGAQYLFVTNKLTLPTTQAQAEALALNVDEDGHTDNKFGQLLSLLTSAAPKLELQPALDQAVNNGQIVSLHVVRADDPMNDPSVSWSITLGLQSQSPPQFDGSDKFALDSAVPSYTPIVGSVANGQFAGGPGAAKIKVSLLGQSVDVDLIGVRIEADLSANGCLNGKLGGGITGEELRGKLLPAMADGLNQIVKADQDLSNTLLQVFDSDNNGAITGQELENNPLLMIAISPDLDLLDASGAFNPGHDGVKESYSVGLGFTCVPASFAVPVASIP